MMNGKYARVWFAIFMLLVFLSGLATGVLIDRTVIARTPIEAAPPEVRRPAARPGPMPMGPGRLAGRLARELDLTAEQREQIAEIFQRRRARFEALQREGHERFRQEQEAFRAEIRATLTPDQEQRFDTMMQRRDRPMLRRGPRGRGGPGPPGM